MLEHERFIDKAENETGQTVLAYVEGRFMQEGEVVGTSGLLCAIEGGLAFVQEDMLDPGDVLMLKRSEIRGVRLHREVLDASLRIHTEDTEIVFGHLESDAAVELVVAAKLKTSRRDSSPRVTLSEAPEDADDQDLRGAGEGEDEEESARASTPPEPPRHRSQPPPAPRHHSQPPPPPPHRSAADDAVEPVPAAPRSKPVVLLLVMAMVAVGGLVHFVLRAPSHASVTVTVRSAGADVDQVDIFVDGQKRCDFSPCVLELPAGPARIRAAQGSASAHRSLQVTGGKEYAVRLDLPASAADQGQGQHGNMANLELYGASTGIEVFVDGQRKGTLPVVLLDLKPGKIQLLFKGGEEFRSLERTVELEAGKTLVVDDIRLPLRIVKVQFVVDEAVTSVELVRQGHPERVTRLEIGGDGRATQQLDTSHRWAVRAKGKGDLQLYLPISFTDGEPEKTINVVFPTEPDLEGDESAATDAANAPTAVDGETAFLNCNSIPPSQVIVDGRQLGTTPISGIEVAPGTHAVVFVSGEGRKARSVSVKPGETKAVVVRF